MANATLVYSSTENLHTTSIAFTSPTKPIFKSPRRKHLLLKTRSHRLLTLKITRKPWKWKEFQAMQQKLSPCPVYQVQFRVTNWPEQVR